jgi:diguanylate cyclase (GGDEF)-like protein
MYRWLFSCSTVLCGTQAAVVVLSVGAANYPGVPTSLSLESALYLGVIVLAAALRWSINVGLVMVAIALSSPTARVRDLFANFSEQLLEAGAMSLGLVAASVVMTNPIVLPGIVIALVALHRGVLIHQYEQASRVDTKTGLASAGWWHETAEQTLLRTRARNTTMGLLLIDLDHFKQVNDTYGHPFGDEVLSAVAMELKAEVRDDDACGRWGGEEFAIVLPDVGDEESLRRVAERIRLRIRSLRLHSPTHVRIGDMVTLTASIGGAVYPAEGITSLDELLLAADAALYTAKNGGRNRVCVGASGSTSVVEQYPPSESPSTVIQPRPESD